MLPGFGWDGNPTRMVFLVRSRSFLSSPTSGWGVAEQAEETKNQPLLDPTGAWMFSLCSLAGGSVPVKNSFSQQTLLQPLIWSHTFIIFPPLRFLRPLQSNWIKKIILFDLGFRLKGSDFLSLRPSVKVPLQPKDDFIYRCALHLWIEAAEETRGVLRSLSTEAIPRFWGSPGPLGSFRINLLGPLAEWSPSLQGGGLQKFPKYFSTLRSPEYFFFCFFKILIRNLLAVAHKYLRGLLFIW